MQAKIDMRTHLYACMRLYSKKKSVCLAFNQLNKREDFQNVEHFKMNSYILSVLKQKIISIKV